MSNELQDPSGNKQHCCRKPQSLKKDAESRYEQRNQDHGDPERMAKPVYWVLMVDRVLRHPLFGCAFAQHAGNYAAHVSGVLMLFCPG